MADKTVEALRLIQDDKRVDWHARGTCEAAADEIERLRAALESLTKDPPATLDEPDDDAEVIIKMRAIARDALNIHHHSEP